ncbi:hypothetical protein [Duganella violaceipulchra]|uniref:Uncharacterized protein n=1 Tax=Duganella violaceipulchra TaxID=2849652 RepID=A0AA41L5Z2_9BURK|nr:hypothetical protein [Duganella violaceicalia]MBV6322752.1 hypothetical protein [Duganella violaceicalia]MCP2007831.1 hypothetical protein [Duganella violaceicalia]
MANKALSTRQKMTIRVEPSQKPPRNPVALAAKARAGGAGPHAKPQATDRQAAKRLLAKLSLKPDPEEK